MCLTSLQKNFTCESTGHQGFTFFQALESEVRLCHPISPNGHLPTATQMEAAKEINSIFPEGLRARVLDFVQFKNTARMDDLGQSLSALLRENR
jgi:alpha-1,3-glucosyltransferase